MNILLNEGLQILVTSGTHGTRQTHTAYQHLYQHRYLTHLPLMTHYVLVHWISIGSGNGLSSVRRRAITRSNADLLSIGPLWTNFSEIRSEILTFPFKKTGLKFSSGKFRPFCLGLNLLTPWGQVTHVCIRKLCNHWLRQYRVNCSGPNH